MRYKDRKTYRQIHKDREREREREIERERENTTKMGSK